MNSRFAIALHILGFLAARDGEPLTSDVLADTYGTTPVVLRRVLAALNRAGLVESKRGAQGGSLLARSPDTITLRDAYDAINSDSDLFKRHPGTGRGGVANILGSYINGLYDEAERALLLHLDSITIAQMDAEVRPRICASLRRTLRKAQ